MEIISLAILLLLAIRLAVKIFLAVVEHDEQQKANCDLAYRLEEEERRRRNYDKYVLPYKYKNDMSSLWENEISEFYELSER